MQSEKWYMFVDGGYIKKAFEKWAEKCVKEKGELEMSAARSLANSQIFKVFYYDCTKDIETDPVIQSLLKEAGWQIRLGTLKGEEKRQRQKEVDIRLAVDALSHATNRNFTHAALLSGDLDFKPLIDELVRMGIYVTLVSDPDDTSVDLIHSADSHISLQYSSYYRLSTESFRRRIPMLVNIDTCSVPDGWKANVLRTAQLNNNYTLHVAQISGEYLLITKGDDWERLLVKSASEESLLWVCKDRYGKVSWL